MIRPTATPMRPYTGLHACLWRERTLVTLRDGMLLPCRRHDSFPICTHDNLQYHSLIRCASEDIGLADNQALPLVCRFLHAHWCMLKTVALTSSSSVPAGRINLPGLPDDRDARVRRNPCALRHVLGGD